MTISNKRILFIKIRWIDSKSLEFSDREFWIDVAGQPEPERAKLKALMDQSTITGPDFREVRHLFHLGTFDDIAPQDMAGYRMTCITDYFEDEDGNGLDTFEMRRMLSGEEYPIMPDDVRSVLCLGPSPILRKELWTTETANTLAHYFQLIELIGSSPWLKKKLSIGTNQFNDSTAPVYSFECPALNEMLEILMPFRQLYGQDQVFNKACKIYMGHVGDERKRDWVKWAKGRFNATLKSLPTPMAIHPFKVREILDLTLYGSGLFHYGETPLATRQAFKELIEKNQRERVIFLFVSYCQQLYIEANHVYQLATRDYLHWTRNEGCPEADINFLNVLFTSRRLEVETPFHQVERLITRRPEEHGTTLNQRPGAASTRHHPDQPQS